MSSTLSPQQAADRVGTSRWTVSRALLSADLEGTRNNRGHWRIEAGTVDAWAALHVRSEVRSEHPTEHDSKSDSEPDRIFEIENAGLKVEVTQLRERLTDANAERDRLAGLLETALQPRPGIFSRLFRNDR
jgi:excisionase family DNA binding protein